MKSGQRDHAAPELLMPADVDIVFAYQRELAVVADAKRGHSRGLCPHRYDARRDQHPAARIDAEGPQLPAAAVDFLNDLGFASLLVDGKDCDAVSAPRRTLSAAALIGRKGTV